jgi:hypothetical protein
MDLEPFWNHLREYRDVVERDKKEGHHPEAFIKLMTWKLDDVGQ